MSKQLGPAKGLIERFIAYDSVPADLSDNVDDNSVKHGYFFRPFNEKDSQGANATFDQQVVPLQWRKQLPASIQARMAAARYSCTMGLFPEIHRAWITFDRSILDDGSNRDVPMAGSGLNSQGSSTAAPGAVAGDRVFDLLLWDYEYEGPATEPAHAEDEIGWTIYGSPAVVGISFSQPITGVGLVVPKGDRIFTDPSPDTGAAVKYLLVAATPVDINLLALTFESASVHGRVSIDIIDDSGMTFSTDGVVFNRVVGTQTGRILMGGSDGCVHELTLADVDSSSSSGQGLLSGLVSGITSKVLTAAGRALGVSAVESLAKRARRVNMDISTPRAVLTSLLGSLPVGGYRIIDMAVDHERHMLYTLALDGRISMYSLGTDGQGFELVARIDDIDAAAIALCQSADAAEAGNRPKADASTFRRGIARDRLRAVGVGEGSSAGGAAGGDAGLSSVLAQQRSGGGAPTSSSSSSSSMAWPLVSLTVVPSRDSRRIHLIATSRSGARFLFTTYTKERYAEVGRLAAAGLMNAPTQQQQPQASSAAGPGASTTTIASAPVQSSGVTLRLVYIRMPPPSPASSVEDKPEGYPPAEGGGAGNGAAEPATAILAGSYLTLIATPASAAGPNAGSVSGRAAGGDHLIAASRDYLSRPRGAGAAAGTGSGPSYPRGVTEVVTDVTLPLPVSSCVVYSIGEVTPEPSILVDPVLAPLSGALVLRDAETAPLPYRSWEARRGVGIDAQAATSAAASSPLTSFVGSPAGAKRTRDEISASSSSSSASAAASSGEGSIVKQTALDDSGVLPRYQHLVRRRLWDQAPGRGCPTNDWAVQHDAASSCRSFVVLTSWGVVKARRVRPIDQLARVLARAQLPGGSGNGASGTSSVGVPGGLRDPGLDRYLSLVPSEEAFSMMAAIACGALRQQQLQQTSVGGRKVSRPASDVSLGGSSSLPAGSDDALASSAARAFNLYGGQPRWRPDATMYTSSDLLFSVKAGGLMLYMSRLLKPIWGASCFIAPPSQRPGQPAAAAAAPSSSPVFAGATLPLIGIALMGARIARSDADFRKTEVREGLLLPRYTRDECLALHRQLTSLADFIKATFDNVAKISAAGEAMVRRIVGQLGMGREAGYADDDVPAPLPLPTADPAAVTANPGRVAAQLHQRAQGVETVYLYLAHKLCIRAAEACAVMAAVADPGYAAASVLNPPIPAGGTAAIQTAGDAGGLDQLRSLAASISWCDLITDRKGEALADGLFTRVLGRLRDNNTADASGVLPVAGGAILPASHAKPAASLGYYGQAMHSVSSNGAASASSKQLASTGNGAIERLDPASRLAGWLRDHCQSFFSEGSRLRVAAHAAADAAAGSHIPSDRGRLASESLRLALQAVASWSPDALSSSMPDLSSLAAKYRNLGAPTAAIQLMLAVASQAAGGPSQLSQLPADADVESSAPDAAASLSTCTAVRRQAYAVVLETLDVARQGGMGDSSMMLTAGDGGSSFLAVGDGASSSSSSSSSLPRAFLLLLSESLRAKDAYYHDTLYRWLAGRATGLASLLVSITGSPYLEDWLAYRAGGDDARDLLFTYYQHHKHFAKAARLQRDLAGATPPLLTDAPTIDTRVRRLQLAVRMASESRVQLSGAIPAGDLVEWKALLSLMEVQAAVKAAVASLVERAKAAVAGARDDQARIDASARLSAYTSALPALTHEAMTADALYKTCRDLDVKDGQIAVLALPAVRPPSSPDASDIISFLYRDVFDACEEAVLAGDMTGAVFAAPGAVPPSAGAGGALSADVSTLLTTLMGVVGSLARRFYMQQGQSATSVSPLSSSSSFAGLLQPTSGAAASPSSSALLPGDEYAFPLTRILVELELCRAAGVEVDAIGQGSPATGEGWVDSVVEGAGGDVAAWPAGWLAIDALRDLPWSNRYRAYSGLLDDLLSPEGPLAIAASSGQQGGVGGNDVVAVTHLVRALVSLIDAWRSEVVTGGGSTSSYASSFMSESTGIQARARVFVERINEIAPAAAAGSLRSQLEACARQLGDAAGRVRSAQSRVAGASASSSVGLGASGVGFGFGGSSGVYGQQQQQHRTLDLSMLA